MQVGSYESPFKLKEPELIRDVLDFRKIFCQIGNMMALPNKAGTKKIKRWKYGKSVSSAETLNQFRGLEPGFHDYMSYFLQELDKFFVDNPDNSDCNENLKDIFDQNDFYFGQEKGKISSIDDFCKENYIDDNYKNKDTFKFLFDEKGEKDERYIFWWDLTGERKWYEGDNMKNYIKKVKQYIASATPLINDRTDKIIEKLKEFLGKD